jgi:hypothetical protein
VYTDINDDTVSLGKKPVPGGVMYVCRTFARIVPSSLTIPTPSLFALPSSPIASIFSSLSPLRKHECTVHTKKHWLILLQQHVTSLISRVTKDVSDFSPFPLLAKEFSSFFLFFLCEEVVMVNRTAAVYRSVAAALTLGSIMALLLVGSVERSSTSASAAGIELVGTSADYKWKGQKPEVNVFDDYDQDFQEGKWKDYKEPSNVFDDLPELENADHKWEVRVTNLCINMQIFATSIVLNICQHAG